MPKQIEILLNELTQIFNRIPSDKTKSIINALNRDATKLNHEQLFNFEQDAISPAEQIDIKQILEKINEFLQSHPAEKSNLYSRLLEQYIITILPVRKRFLSASTVDQVENSPENPLTKDKSNDTTKTIYNYEEIIKAAYKNITFTMPALSSTNSFRVVNNETNDLLRKIVIEPPENLSDAAQLEWAQGLKNYIMERCGFAEDSTSDENLLVVPSLKTEVERKKFAEINNFYDVNTISLKKEWKKNTFIIRGPTIVTVKKHILGEQSLKEKPTAAKKPKHSAKEKSQVEGKEKKKAAAEKKYPDNKEAKHNKLDESKDSFSPHDSASSDVDEENESDTDSAKRPSKIAANAQSKKAAVPALKPPAPTAAKPKAPVMSATSANPVKGPRCKMTSKHKSKEKESATQKPTAAAKPKGNNTSSNYAELPSFKKRKEVIPIFGSPVAVTASSAESGKSSQSNDAGTSEATPTQALSFLSVVATLPPTSIRAAALPPEAPKLGEPVEAATQSQMPATVQSQKSLTGDNADKQDSAADVAKIEGEVVAPIASAKKESDTSKEGESVQQVDQVKLVDVAPLAPANVAARSHENAATSGPNEILSDDEELRSAQAELDKQKKLAEQSSLQRKLAEDFIAKKMIELQKVKEESLRKAAEEERVYREARAKRLREMKEEAEKIAQSTAQLTAEKPKDSDALLKLQADTSAALSAYERAKRRRESLQGQTTIPAAVNTAQTEQARNPQDPASSDSAAHQPSKP